PGSAVFLTSGCCENTEHVTADMLTALGLQNGIFNGEHYPLTQDESAYIAEEFIDLGPYKKSALIGYSALIGNRKYLVPTLEFSFDNTNPDDHSQMDAMQEYVRAQRMMAAISEATDGHYSIDELRWDHSLTFNSASAKGVYQ